MCNFLLVQKIFLLAQKNISSAKFWYLYNIFAGRRLIYYWRKYSSGSVNILSRPKILIWSEWIRARTKEIFVQQKNFSKYSSVTTSYVAEEFRKIFFGCKIFKIKPFWSHENCSLTKSQNALKRGTLRNLDFNVLST
jgi:hypothetical protein